MFSVHMSDLLLQIPCAGTTRNIPSSSDQDSRDGTTEDIWSELLFSGKGENTLPFMTSKAHCNNFQQIDS